MKPKPNPTPAVGGSFGASLVAIVLVLMLCPVMACATSGSDDGGDSGLPTQHDAKAEADGACGALDQPCCAPPMECNTGAFCAPDNICKQQHPKDQGHTCSGSSSCSTGLCVYTQGLGDGGPVIPDGAPPPDCPSTGCTAGCASTSDCLGGWTCSMTLIGEGLCTCTCAEEICDGMDNNCDGIIDNEPAADKWCATQMEGIPSKCVKGECQCLHMCDEECVNLDDDPNNCGKCNHACTPTVEKCEKGDCVCAYTVCDGKCVDTKASDNANCGACGKTCDYQCTKGVCGPATIPVTLSSIGPIAVDATNVYWLGVNSSSLNEVDYCPLAGCTTPSILAAATSVGDEFEGVSLSSMALNGTTVYFADGEENIVECAKPPTGCSGTASFYNSGSADFDETSIAADSTKVYWANDGALTVYDCAAGTTCASPTLLQDVAESNPQGIAVSSTTLYWASTTETSSFFDEGVTIFEAPIGGGAITTLCSNATLDVDNIGQLIVAGVSPNEFVYFSDGESAVYSCATSAPGVAPTMYVSAEEPEGLASDGTNVYWGETTFTGSSFTETGSIMKCALGATCASPTTLVKKTDQVDGIAVGDTNVYWTALSSSDTPEVFFFSK